MNIRRSASIIILAVVSFSTNVIAQDISIYRWVDENNVVHFSQHQPKDDKYSQLTTFASYKAESQKVDQQSSPQPSVNDQIAQHEKEQAEIKAKNKEIAESNCKAAQLNIKMLNSFNQVLTTDPDGNSHILSDKEKTDKLALSEKHIDLYCDK
jgi:septal ring factor EnvC (AmiA/AmiB activator)